MQIEKFDFKSLSASEEKAASGLAGFGTLFTTPSPMEDKKVDVAILEKKPEVAPAYAPASGMVKEKNYNEKELSDSRNSGFQEGYAKGYKDAKTDSDSINKQISDSLQAISVNLTKAFEAKAAADLYNMGGVAEIITRVAKKICQTELAHSPVESIEKVVQNSFKLLFEESKVIIHVNPAVLEAVKQKVTHIATSQGFKGEMEIIAGENIAAGDCTINWQGGGLKSNKHEILAEIDKMCSECFGIVGSEGGKGEKG
jgi:flagellar biosynthesis/type III secretory pathway protein FliH